MIDWHSHILPGMDDGSRDVAESLLLLKMLADQGVDTVAATPHFYANDESLEQFLDRRKKSYEALKAELPENAPRVLPGAEVRYYPGISRMSGLKGLCIEGTKLLLLEMPVSNWTEYTVRELVELAGHGNLKIVLAHVERYMSLQSSRAWRRLRDSGILMQVNAGFFTSIGTKRKALSLLNSGEIQFIGSDCHDTATRPPKLDHALEIITKKLGEGFVDRMNIYGQSMIGK